MSNKVENNQASDPIETEDALLESIHETPQESTQDSLHEPTQYALHEPTQNHPQESTQIALQDSTQVTPQESSQDTSQESPQDTPQESTQDTPQESTQDTLQKSIQDTPQESIQDTPQESPQDTLQESIQNTTQESIQDTPQESTQDTPQESTQDTPQESTQDTPQESTQDTPQESTPDTPQESTQDSIQSKEVISDRLGSAQPNNSSHGAIISEEQSDPKIPPKYDFGFSNLPQSNFLTQQTGYSRKAPQFNTVPAFAPFPLDTFMQPIPLGTFIFASGFNRKTTREDIRAALLAYTREVAHISYNKGSRSAYIRLSTAYSNREVVGNIAGTLIVKGDPISVRPVEGFEEAQQVKFLQEARARILTRPHQKRKKGGGRWGGKVKKRRQV